MLQSAGKRSSATVSSMEEKGDPAALLKDIPSGLQAGASGHGVASTRGICACSDGRASGTHCSCDLYQSMLARTWRAASPRAGRAGLLF